MSEELLLRIAVSLESIHMTLCAVVGAIVGVGLLLGLPLIFWEILLKIIERIKK